MKHSQLNIESKNWDISRIWTMGIFWHNDKPGGFGIWFPPESAKEMAATFEQVYQKFREESLEERESFLKVDVYEQLSQAVELYEKSGDDLKNLPTEEYATFLVIGPGNVYILEREGMLHPVDEWNGCVFGHEMHSGDFPIK